MYLPEFFHEDRPDALHAFMSEYPFATLIAFDGGQPLINHLPMLLRAADGTRGTLVGHVARANPVWQALAARADATAVFHGPAGYVSPSWYPSKARHHKVVPTWNYAVVHAQGRVRVVEEDDWLRDLVRDLTDRHEAASRIPWRVADAPEDFVATMIRQIVGLELEITRLTGKWKLSQNRPADDVAGVIDGLSERGAGPDIALAALMRRHLS
jgi:transcriptional regulator